MNLLRSASRARWLLLAADGVAVFGTWIDFLAIMTLAAYRFQVTPVQMALFSAAGILPGILVSPWVGRLCDRGPVKRHLLVSITLRIAATVAILLCHDLWLLTVLVACRSGLSAVVAPALGVIAVRSIAAEDRPRFYAVLNVLNSSAKVLAPALGTIASSATSETTTLAASLFFALVSLGLFALVRVPNRASPIGAANATANSGHSSGFAIFVWVVATYAFFVFMVNNLFPLMLQRSGFDKALLGILVSCSGAGNVLSGLWLARRTVTHPMKGQLAELLSPGAFAATGFFLIGITLWHAGPATEGALCALFFVGGTFSARFAVAANVYVSTRHAESIGHSSALIQGWQNAMILGAPLLGAVVLEHFGPASVFLVASAAGGLSLGAAAIAERSISNRAAGVKTHRVKRVA